MSSDGSEHLRERIREKVRLGHFDEAIALSEEALELARAGGDAADADFALCNHAGLLVSQNRCGELIPELRRILMRNSDAKIRFLAAYAISRHHDQRRETERGIFYARLALDHARAGDDPQHLASAHNNLANLLLLDSLFGEAAEHYRRSLELMDDEESVDRALMKSNLGYCLTILGEVEEAFRELTRSLRLLRRIDGGTWRLFPHLGLSHAYLEVARFDLARRHALRALEMAESSEATGEQTKNALYLLGEAEKLSGNTAAAYETFHRLQECFYPDEPFVTDVLLSTDIRKMINLMA